MEIGSINVVLMREQSTAEEINDVVIVPPFSFRNALPCNVFIRRVNNETRYMLRVFFIMMSAVLGGRREIYLRSK